MPRTPAPQQPRAEGPYVTGLPPDQMTALERQLTAELAQCQAGWSRELDESIRREAHYRARIERLSAVVEAARKAKNFSFTAAGLNQDLAAALDALGGSP